MQLKSIVVLFSIVSAVLAISVPMKDFEGNKPKGSDSLGGEEISGTFRRKGHLESFRGSEGGLYDFYNLEHQEEHPFIHHRDENFSDNVKTISVVKTVPVPHPVKVEKKVPYEGNDRPYPVYISKPYPVYIEKNLPYEVKVPEEKPYPFYLSNPYNVYVEKRIPYIARKHIPYSIKKPYPVEIEKEIPYPVKVPFVKLVPFHLENPLPYPVQKVVKYPVKIPIEVPYPTDVDKHHEGFGHFTEGERFFHTYPGRFGSDSDLGSHHYGF